MWVTSLRSQTWLWCKKLHPTGSLLYSISIFQSRFDTEGSKYFQKKIAEGKSKKLARKHLARQVSNQIWKILFAA